MRFVTIDIPNDQDAWVFNCFAYIENQSYQMHSGYNQTDLPLRPRKVLVRALRDFADYIDRSAEWGDDKVPDPSGTRARYRKGRLEGSGL